MSVTRNVIISLGAVSLILGCGGGGSGGGGSDGPANSLGLNGVWGGVAEDDEFDVGTIVATIEDRSIVKLIVDGIETGETAQLTRSASDVFEYSTSSDVIGGFLTDSGSRYAVFVNELWDFGVLQRGASAPFGVASLADLDGEWSGSVIGFFGEEYYRYNSSGFCTTGSCIFTVTSPVVDSEGNELFDVTGLQSLVGVGLRSALAFDLQWVNEVDSGVGAAVLSKDKKFLGAYLCPPNYLLEDCEFAAMTKQ